MLGKKTVGFFEFITGNIQTLENEIQTEIVRKTNSFTI